jgi:DNA helicase-2/ATP-dependent DNA helicase PcrA
VSVASLNPAQSAAVRHERGPLLVIAGAGSGKTRVLTARVAHLLERGVPPEGVLAFTFTNRAAREMRERLEAELGPLAARLWIGTFHATALRLLRREAPTLGLPADFTIYDREDQEGLVRELVREAGLPETVYRTGLVLARISDSKNALVAPEEAQRAARSEFDRTLAGLYERYQRALRRAGGLDFDDLIGEAVRLWTEHAEAGARWSRRFRHVLVDEYQDTNHAQFRFVHALASAHGEVFVVGDDDQSIYGWRGADLANVLDFERAFPGATTVRLEQNYRSTRNILAAANAVIANNRARKGKTLWSEREAGLKLGFTLLADEAFEARRIRQWLVHQRARGRRLADCAVLYRTNAQSRALETELRQAGLAYEIVGGVSFFQRREVKDVLAYLRLVANPLDVAAFFRIWNTPRRGLGPAVERELRERLAAPGEEPVRALREMLAEGALRGAARSGAAQLVALVDGLRERLLQPLPELFTHLLEASGYLEHLDAGGEAELDERRANVEELGVAAAAFAARGREREPGVFGEDEPEPRAPLLAWLSECSLLTDADRLSGGDRVLLLTVHNAKGLEFDAVAIAGLEEGLLPHASSLEREETLEEERRLFYVALTRARDEVLLAAAAYRRRFDGARGSAVSRFVGEIPAELLEREDAAGGTGAWRGRSHGGPAWSGRARAREPVAGSWGEAGDAHAEGDDAATVPASAGRTRQAKRAVGRRVVHETFGAGTVVAADGEGPDMKLTVRFAGATKKVFARFVTGAGDGD